MGAEVAAGAAIVGVGMQAYGQYKASEEKAAAARQDARLRKAQAKEMLERLNIEEQDLRLEGESFKAEQQTAYAKSGVAIGSGATLLALEDTNYKITKQLQTMRRDVTFRADQILKGAQYTEQSASSIARAGSIMAGATLLQGGADIYANSPGNKSKSKTEGKTA